MSGAIKCGPGGSCLDGYYCEPMSTTCWKNGESPAGVDMAGPDDGGDGGEPDLAGLLDNGTQCAASGLCASGNCVDGYCCDTKCDTACSACNLPGAEGTCTKVPGGQSPHHLSCPLDAMTTCMHNGLCDGMGACQLWPNTTVCKDSSCDSGTNMFTPQSTCDGAGMCKTPAAITCAPYLCKDTKVCYASCTATPGQCSSPNSCTMMSCGPKPLGADCMSGSECASTYCVDGVCCDGQCNGQCEACKVGGNTGHCSAVNGAPVSPRTPCASDGTSCGGSCNGTLRTACTFPVSGSPGCHSSVCSTDSLTKYVCNGVGTCVMSSMSCGTYTCNGTASPNACYVGLCASGKCAAGHGCCSGYTTCMAMPCPPPP